MPEKKSCDLGRHNDVGVLCFPSFIALSRFPLGSRFSCISLDFQTFFSFSVLFLFLAPCIVDQPGVRVERVDQRQQYSILQLLMSPADICRTVNGYLTFSAVQLSTWWAIFTFGTRFARLYTWLFVCSLHRLKDPPVCLSFLFDFFSYTLRVNFPVVG